MNAAKRKRAAKDRAQITDGYILKLVKGKGGTDKECSRKDLTPEFFDAYRKNIQLKRELKKHGH